MKISLYFIFENISCFLLHLRSNIFLHFDMASQSICTLFIFAYFARDKMMCILVDLYIILTFAFR